MSDEQAERLIAALERLAAAMERQPTYTYPIPTPHVPPIPAWTPGDCACPPNTLCMNVACPRRIVGWQTTTKGETSDR
jgi:hypothetical protein